MYTFFPWVSTYNIGGTYNNYIDEYDDESYFNNTHLRSIFKKKWTKARNIMRPVIMEKCLLFVLIIKTHFKNKLKINVPKPIVRIIVDHVFYYMTALCLAQNYSTMIKNLNRQTSEICATAIKIIPWCLMFVKHQTLELCVQAVKIDGHTLPFVKQQTDEICYHAVTQSGDALKYVKKQTPLICIKALTENIGSFVYIKKHIKKQILKEIGNFPDLSKYKIKNNAQKLYSVYTDDSTFYKKNKMIFSKKIYKKGRLIIRG